MMVDRTSPDNPGAGLAVSRLLVAAGLVIGGLFAGTGVSAGADAAPVVSPYSYTVSDTPAFDEPTGSRIG